MRRGLSEIDPFQTQSNIGPLRHKAYRLVTGAELVFVGCSPKTIMSVAARLYLEQDKLPASFLAQKGCTATRGRPQNA